MDSISIAIPTRSRPSYLEVALASIAPQAARAGAEVVVIDDQGPSSQRRAMVERFGARYRPHPRPLGLNVARNTAVAACEGDVVVFVDDDVEASPGWLGALARAIADHPEIEVFTGPIRPRLEGRPPRSCGREGAPITTLDLGDADSDRIPYAWGANMAIRREALRRVGPFDEHLSNGGDEQEWQDRLRRRGGGPILYVAGAALDHRRCPRDSRLRALALSAYRRGRSSRAYDAWRGQAPTLARELLTLAGCLYHVLRRRCPAGLTMVAHSLGRVRGSLNEPPVSPREEDDAEDDFLSGSSGEVGGLDALRRDLRDRMTDVRDVLGARRLRISLAARREPPRRRVRVLTVARPQHRELARSTHRELMRSRHEVHIDTRPPGSLGKFENLNRMLTDHPLDSCDWLMIVDDDVVLPRGFLDRFLFLAERFSLDLAQPAHRARSHAAWAVTRRRSSSVVRETAFVEIGPVTALRQRTLPELLPFPALRMGWGLDLHWSALGRRQGWRLGVVDAVTIGHAEAPVAATYSRQEAIAEARAFLADHPHLSAREAQETLVTHQRW